MSVKVKRGLGLLVVAVIAWLIAIALLQIDTSGTAANLLVAVPLFAAALACIGALISGLGLLAWGLLRD